MTKFFANLFNKLFGRCDAASERIAVALEEIADEVEALRDGMRQSIAAYTAAPAPTVPVIPDAGDDGSSTPTNGKPKRLRAKA